MSDDPSADVIDRYGRGCDLRDSGAAEDALSLWADLAKTQKDGLSEDAQYYVAAAAYAHAHLLESSGRQKDASAINASFIARSAGSPLFEIRLLAATASREQIRIYRQRGDHEPAVGYAEQMVEMMSAERSPTHLIRASECVLAGAEALDVHPLWKRSPPSARDQAQKMINTVIEMAQATGGDLALAVAANARIVQTGLQARERRVATFVRERANEPTIPESALAALQATAEEAKQSGANRRYIRLMLIKATSLSELGRVAGATQVMDHLISELQTDERLGGRGDVSLARALRKTIVAAG